jgi:hypothetical protein
MFFCNSHAAAPLPASCWVTLPISLFTAIVHGDIDVWAFACSCAPPGSG